MSLVVRTHSQTCVTSVCRAEKDVKYSFVSVNKFIDAYKQSPAYQRQQLALSAPPEINPDAPDPLVRGTCVCGLVC